MQSHHGMLAMKRKRATAFAQKNGYWAGENINIKFKPRSFRKPKIL